MTLPFDAPIFEGWPYLGLAGAILGLLALAVWPRPAGAPSRLRDPSWLACTVWPIYALHQFEEHGIDALGRHYQFIHELCATLGHPSLADCPADDAFVFAVNPGAVWLLGLGAILLRKRNPLAGMYAFGLPLVNSFAHVGAAIAHGAYNAGLLTSVLVFWPACAWVIHIGRTSGLLAGKRVLGVIASGGVVHAILLAALLSYAAGFFPRALMLALETLNGLVPLAIATIVMKRSTSLQPASSAAA